MYPVSEDFKTVMKKASRIEHVRGSVSGVSFTDENIMSLSYSNRCSDTKDVTFGSAYIGQLDVSFINLNIPRGSWRGQIIFLDYGLELDDEGTTEWVPIGVFYVASAEWTDTGVSVTAYDCLSLLDRPVQFTSTIGKIYDIMSLVSSMTGVTVGRTQADYEALPNGLERLQVREPNDISTYRDLVSWLGATVGGFATADRDGALILRSFAESSNVDSLAARERVVGSVFSDYTTQYEGISVTDFDSGSTVIYTAEGKTGALIALGNDPLLQNAASDIRNRSRQVIANVAGSIEYTPMQITLLNCPVYDLGDLIECRGGVAGSENLVGCVMSIEWSFKNTITLQGFGADPNLSAGKTKADKAISALSKQGKDSDITYHTHRSASEIEIDTTESVLYEIDFVVSDVTTLNIWHEIKELNIFDGSSQSVELFYYYDGELQSFEPVDTFTDSGKYHSQIGHYYLENVPAGEVHTWRVTARTDNGTAVIKRGDLIAEMWGQKVVAVEGDIVPDQEDIYTLDKLGTPAIVSGLKDHFTDADLDTDYSPTPIGNYLELEAGGYLELEQGGYLELEGGN